MTQHSKAIRLMVPSVFVLLSVVSAFLVFSVQPLISRMVLPMFGGAAAVWSVALAFFQLALMAGYVYAHLLTRVLSVRRAAAFHIGFLAIGAVVLPFSVHETAFAGMPEAVRLMLVLLLAVGVPFIAISANAPLFQVWFVAMDRDGRRNPYPLYAASNMGSFAALIAYPVLIEPLAPLRTQAVWWTAGYWLLFVIIVLTAWRLPSGGDRQAGPIRLDRARLPSWIVLSAVPSAALVAATQHLTTDVAAVPFLWVMPLALYLLSFVVAFGDGAGRAARWATCLSAPVLVVLAVTVGFSIRLGVIGDLCLHLSGFFIIALVAHGALAARRPPAHDLTGFYLALSVGGSIGGLSAALVAPALFSFVAEYPLSLVVAALVLAGPAWRWPLAAGVAGLLVMGLVLPWSGGTKTTLRSFYAVHSIEDTPDGMFRLLRSGMEVHGVARRTDIGPTTGAKPLPLAYYHLDSPISEAIDAVRARKGGTALRIGVVGLGAGAIACLAEDMDHLDFYEIDPVVIRIARDASRFPFLSRCGAQARIIEGDARRSLTDSQATYDILIIDAFSSDAIPVHLLTREAFAVYRQRSTPDGVILLHISNNHLNLNGIVASTAASLGLGVLLNDEEQDPANLAGHLYQPTVAVAAGRKADFGPLTESEDWIAPDGDRALPAPWTDQSANLLSAVIDGLGRR